MIGRTTRAECSSYLYGGSLSLSDYLQVFYRILPTSLWRNSSDFCLSVTQVMVTANATWLHSIVLKILTDRIVIFTRLLEHLQEFPIPDCHSYFFWQKQKKLSPTVPHPRLPFMPSSEKEPPRAYICALVSAAHPFVSEEVEGHKYNFVSLSGS